MVLPSVVQNVQFSPRQLAFLENEMEEIKNDKSRDTEDRSIASSVLGIVQGDLEVTQQTKLNNDEKPPTGP